MPEQQWQARVEGALNAHFKQENAPSRPGTDWKIGLKRGDETYSVFVRAYLADGVSKATRDDTTYQGQTVIGYVFDRLAAGWSPAEAPLPALTILTPNRAKPHPRHHRSAGYSADFSDADERGTPVSPKSQ
jgi:hypothetical protein